MIVKSRFDACYDTNAPQEELFRKEIEPLIENVTNGINTTVFAYGVTGAGNHFRLIL